MRTVLLLGLIVLGSAPAAALASEMVLQVKDAEKQKEVEHERTHFYADPLNANRGAFFGPAPKKAPFFQARPKPYAPAVHRKK